MTISVPAAGSQLSVNVVDDSGLPLPLSTSQAGPTELHRPRLLRQGVLHRAEVRDEKSTMMIT